MNTLSLLVEKAYYERMFPSLKLGYLSRLFGKDPSNCMSMKFFDLCLQSTQFQVGTTYSNISL